MVRFSFELRPPTMNFPRTRTSLRCTLDAAAQEVDVAHPQRDDLTAARRHPAAAPASVPPRLAGEHVVSRRTQIHVARACLLGQLHRVRRLLAPAVM